MTPSEKDNPQYFVGISTLIVKFMRQQNIFFTVIFFYGPFVYWYSVSAYKNIDKWPFYDFSTFIVLTLVWQNPKNCEEVQQRSDESLQQILKGKNPYGVDSMKSDLQKVVFTTF